MPKLIDHEAWLASLEGAVQELEGARAEYVYNALEREETLGLEHRKGEILHDRVTGGRCTVLAGTRKRVTQVPSPGD